MTRDGIRYHKNLTEKDECVVCHDEGWVELQGTERHHGYTYSRGTAPCHWCEAGSSAYVAHHKRGRPKNGASNYSLASDYTIADVAGYDPNPELLSKTEASRLIRDLLPNLGQP